MDKFILEIRETPSPDQSIESIRVDEVALLESFEIFKLLRLKGKEIYSN